MQHIKLTVEQHPNGSLSLWIEYDDMGPQTRHRGAYELAENFDHATFYRVVARRIADYAADGIRVTYKDRT
jgi:hypothetical protein